MPKGKKEALKEQLDKFESFITKQKQISKSLQDDKIDISNEKLWENINGVNKENRVNWFKPDNLKILVKDSKARNQKEGQNLTIADAKGKIERISNDDRLKAYAVGIVNCIKAKFLDGNTYDSKGKQWDDILKDLTDNIKNLNEIQDQLTKNSDKLKPGLFGKIVGRIKNWVASSPKEVRDIKCQDDETVYKKLESIIGQKNKLLDCGDKGKGAIEAQIKWRNGKQEMSNSQKEFWLNKGNSALLENLGKLKFEESNNIENFLEELKEIAGYNDDELAHTRNAKINRNIFPIHNKWLSFSCRTLEIPCRYRKRATVHTRFYIPCTFYGLICRVNTVDFWCIKADSIYRISDILTYNVGFQINKQH